MKRNILMFGCIICCLILVSLSYQPIIADESNEKDILKVKKIKGYIFLIGSIYNLSYTEEMIEEVMFKIYRFNCTRVLAFMGVPRVLFFRIERYNNGFSTVLIDTSFNGVKGYHRGYIGEYFVCALQIIENEVE